MRDQTHGVLATATQRLFAATARLPNDATPSKTRFRVVKQLMLRALRIQSRQQRDFDRSVLDVLEAMRLALETIDAKVEALTGHDALTDVEYAKFEDVFRGEAGERLAIYPPLVKRALDRSGGGRVLDLGCGRGDLLQLLTGCGIDVEGVDSSPAMVLLCREKGLEVNCRDALAMLEALDDRSASAVLSLHTIEHWPVGQVVKLITAASDKLKPGGLLALETPYAIQGAAARDFVLDPTHVRPLHPEFLSFVLGEAGFSEREIRPLAPCDARIRLGPLEESAGAWSAQANRNFELVNNALFGFRDFVALGWR